MIEQRLSAGGRPPRAGDTRLVYRIVTPPPGDEQSLTDFLVHLRQRVDADVGFDPLLLHLYTSLLPDVTGLADQVAEVFAQPPASVAFLQPPVGWTRAALIAGVRRGDGPDDWTAFAVTSGAGHRYEDALVDAYRRAERGLAEIGRSFPDVLRSSTIFGTVEEDPAQVFECLNAGRKRFYADLSFPATATEGIPKYPANTGVRDRSRGVKVSGVLGPRSVRNHAIGNPVQSDPTEYTFTTTPPQFARAMAYELDERVGLLVSGAVSVVGKEIHAAGNATEQVEQVCRNLRALLDPANLARQGVPVSEAADPEITYLLTMVRSADDAAAVDDILLRCFGVDTPRLVVEAALSMPGLLVEVECVADYQRA